MRILRQTMFAVIAATGTLSAVSAPAAQIPFPEPTEWNVGDLGTTFQEWSAGTTAPNSSILAVDALAWQTNPVLGGGPTFGQTGAFVAGSGGLYQFQNNYSIVATVPNHGGPGLGTWVLIQAASTLNPDYDPEENGTGGSLLQDAIKIFDDEGELLATSDPASVIRTHYDDNYPLFGGTEFEKLAWSVFLPGYTGDFSVTADLIIHSSLQAFRIDSAITAVPEPATVSLLAFGAAALVASGLWRRRRSSAVEA
jgi:hypothetical protein